MLDAVEHPPKRRGAARTGPLTAHLDRTIARVRRLTGVTLAFGGPVDSEGLLLDRFSGTVVGPLAGVKLPTGCGVGGKAIAAQRPVVVSDYFQSRGITHQYDRVVRAEGLRSMAAVPVIVGRRSVAVIYGAMRGSEMVGDRVIETLVNEVRALEQQLAVERALDKARTMTMDTVFQENRLLRNSIRDLHADLRRLASVTQDPVVRHQIADRLRELENAQRDSAVEAAVKLTARELDVLTVAATGATNQDIADCLNLTTATIKSYMKVIMNKLGASTRYEAVMVARRRGAIV